MNSDVGDAMDNLAMFAYRLGNPELKNLVGNLKNALHKSDAQRKNARQGIKRRWCDDCVHFKGWKGPVNEEPPASYNPCSKGHKMKFACPPDDYTGDNTGFYLPGCKDAKPA